MFEKLKGNKGFTVALAIAAVGVWGNVFFRVIEKPVVSQKVSRKDKNEGRQASNDSANFALDLNYRDPFALSEQPERKPIPSRTFSAPTKIKTGTPVKAAIFYLGSVVSSSGSRALISYRQKYYHATVNDTIGGFRITSINLDSVRFSINRRAFWVARSRKRATMSN